MTMTLPTSNESLWDTVWVKVIVGSRAYGLHNEASDYDYRGFFAPKTRQLLSFQEIPEQLERDEPDECYWELKKFIRLILANNPNVLEILHVNPELIEFCEPSTFHPVVVKYVQKIIAHLFVSGHRFLSQRIIKTYGGFATAQFHRGMKALEKDPTNKTGWKHLMHVLRLLIAGASALNGDGLMVDVGAYRDDLLKVRQGLYDLQYVTEWYNDLENEFQKAKTRNLLPEAPDEAFAERILMGVREALLIQW